MNIRPHLYSYLFLFICLAWATTSAGKPYSPALEIDSVRKAVTDVASWQMKAYPHMDEGRIWKSNGDVSWENGVFLSALTSWGYFDNNETIIHWCDSIATRNLWQPGASKHRIYYADDIAVCLMYAALFDRHKDDRMIHPTLARLEFIMNNPTNGGFWMDTPNCYDRWTWCDALYMAPPVFLRFANLSGNNKLRDFMDREYWTSYSFLYDKEEKLFYRDSNFFGQRERNGRKVFWGRGNAWVVAGLALILDELPADYPTREKYIFLFKEMMQQVAALQNEEGYWHASMLDPSSYPSPETSSSGFFTYALWWGINNGLLDEQTYLPHARKGWEALVAAIQPDGMLGWVQPVGHDPQKVTKDMTEVYGAGAMAMTGQEIIRYKTRSR